MLAMPTIMCQSSVLSPNASNAGRRYCTLPSWLVTVPSFSAKVHAGKMTWESFAVSVRNGSWQISRSNFSKAPLTSNDAGNVSSGFSPTRYKALISPVLQRLRISIRCWPVWGSGNGAFQAWLMAVRASSLLNGTTPGRNSGATPMSTAPCSLASSIKVLMPQPGLPNFPVIHAKSIKCSICW